MERSRRTFCNVTVGGRITDVKGIIYPLGIRMVLAKGPGDEERWALEDWVRLRFQLASSDPMMAIIGAFGRLTDAGMGDQDAVETVLRILREFESNGCQ